MVGFSHLDNNLFLFRESKSLLDAISDGAMSSVGVVTSIVVNIISFLALLAFCDAALSWLGEMFDCPQLSFGVKETTHRQTLSCPVYQ